MAVVTGVNPLTGTSYKGAPIRVQDPDQDEKSGKPNRATFVESVTEEEYPDNIDEEKPESQSPFFTKIMFPLLAT